MKTPLVHTGALIGCLALSFHVCTASAQFSDNFNTGTDPAWTRWMPQTPVAFSQTFNFPLSSQGGLGYRMTSVTTVGAPNAYNRVGSYVTSLAPITDFLVSVDLINWDNTLGQNMGVMARLTAPITGILPNGYGFGYVNRYSGTGTGTDQLRIWNLATFSQINADPFGVANGSVGQFMGPGANPSFTGGSSAPVPGGDYRLIFWGIGSNLYGQMIDLGTGLPLLVSDGHGGVTDTIRAVNSAFTTGTAGLFAVTGEDMIDPTFDNFSASVVPEPSTLALAGLGLLGLALRKVRRSRHNF
jgi:hypothetical protein